MTFKWAAHIMISRVFTPIMGSTKLLTYWSYTEHAWVLYKILFITTNAIHLDFFLFTSMMESLKVELCSVLKRIGFSVDLIFIWWRWLIVAPFRTYNFYTKFCRIFSDRDGTCYIGKNWFGWGWRIPVWKKSYFICQCFFVCCHFCCLVFSTIHIRTW